MKLRKELDEISEIIDKIVQWVCIVLTFMMFISVTFQVFGRYVTRSTIAWDGRDLALLHDMACVPRFEHSREAVGKFFRHLPRE